MYGVDPKEIKDPRPEFLCRKCGQKFWFEYPPVEVSEEVPTFIKGNSAASAPQASASNRKQCPKCKAENPGDSVSCRVCGIIFEKFGRKRDSGEKAGSPAAPPISLKAGWDNVLANYEKPEVHEKFISDCLGQKQLTYVSAQYRKMLEANPNDTIALKMRDKIIGLATLTFIPPRREDKASERIAFPMMVAMLSGMIGVIGSFTPKLKWLQPVGFSIFLLAAGFLAYKFYKSKAG